LDEIEHWVKYTDAERKRIMRELPRRLAAMGLRDTPAALQS
jgi:predicted Fe-S protein YdhL (DUF1289 family)